MAGAKTADYEIPQAMLNTTCDQKTLSREQIEDIMNTAGTTIILRCYIAYYRIDFAGFNHQHTAYIFYFKN
jgi:hypothetical protein